MLYTFNRFIVVSVMSCMLISTASAMHLPLHGSIIDEAYRTLPRISAAATVLIPTGAGMYVGYNFVQKTNAAITQVCVATASESAAILAEWDSLGNAQQVIQSAAGAVSPLKLALWGGVAGASIGLYTAGMYLNTHRPIAAIATRHIIGQGGGRRVNDAAVIAEYKNILFPQQTAGAVASSWGSWTSYAPIIEEGARDAYTKSIIDHYTDPGLTTAAKGTFWGSLGVVGVCAAGALLSDYCRTD